MAYIKKRFNKYLVFSQKGHLLFCGRNRQAAHELFNNLVYGEASENSTESDRYIVEIDEDRVENLEKIGK